MDGPHKPADVEAARQIEKASPARHQDELAVPYGLKLSLRHHPRPRFRRELNDYLVFAGLAKPCFSSKVCVAVDADGQLPKIKITTEPVATSLKNTTTKPVHLL
jgi:hypothetical protein